MERDKDNVILTSDKQISTHTLTWSVTPARFMRLRSSTFQLTRSRGAWLVISLWHMTTLIFQLTRSRGAWHNEKRHCHSWLIFQLTRSRGAWLTHWNSKHFFFYFNSHAHVERDKSLTCSAVYNPISTHTLTWSVTSLENCYGTGIKISTHTLTWSVTLCSINNDLPINISTHTLTWSVTVLSPFL